MKLGTVLFFAFLGIFALCFSYPIAQVAGRVRTAYVESAEEPLVDTANVLAAIVGQSLERQALQPEDLQQVFDDVRGRSVAAQIYQMRKETVDLSMYITDARGVVTFHADDPAAVGQDYSDWRDVYRTLQGGYGARIRRDPHHPTAPAALMVAAPIRVRGQLAGVLTVIKPTDNIASFVRATRPRIIKIGLLALLVAVVLGLGVSLWVTQQVRRLTRYANDVRAGLRVPFPKLARTELLTMGRAFEKMREALAGQAYVENYITALTHEIKSPLSAIRGAAEILEGEDLPRQTRARFLDNIQTETRRIQELVDRMLRLTELEARRALTTRERVDLGALARTTSEVVGGQLEAKGLTLDLEIPRDVCVRGDPMLLHLALCNLLQNAIDFSPRGGRITLSLSLSPSEEQREGAVFVSVTDQGSGIPSFARDRVFEKFFSLERPDTGKKSTGLGLNFVKEVAELHGGDVQLDNVEPAGLRACLRLPADLGGFG